MKKISWLNSRLVLIAGLIWAGWVGIQFYRTEPFSFLSPFQIVASGFPYVQFPPIPLAASYMRGFLAAVMLGTIAFWFGFRILRLRDFSFLNNLERLIISTGLGWGFLSYGAFALGSCHLLYKIFLQILAVGLFAFALVDIYKKRGLKILGEAWDAVRKSAAENIITSICAVMICLIFLVALAMSFVPEIFYDALVCHLGVPNYYLQEHSLAFLPTLPSQFPLFMQMVYLWGLSLQGDFATKLIHLLMMKLAVLMLIGAGRRLGRNLAGWLAAVIFLLTPTVQMCVWTSGIDVGVAAFSLIGVFCLLMGFNEEKGRKNWHLLAAIFSGLTFASKYTGFVIPVSCFILIAADGFKRRENGKLLLKKLGLFSGIVTLIMLPWFLKNIFQTGNPIFPYLNLQWGHMPLVPEQFAKLGELVKGFTPTSLLGWAQTPWVLMVNDSTSLGFQGPLILGCLFFWAGILLKMKSPLISRLIFIASISIILGLGISRFTRYLLPEIVIWSIVVGLGLEMALAGSGKLGKTVIFSVVLVFGWMQFCWMFIKIHQAFKPAPVLFGRISATQFFMGDPLHMRPHPAVAFFPAIEAELEPGGKVMLVGDEKAYPLNVPHYYSGVHDRTPLVEICNESSNSAQALQKLSSLGITHLFFNLQEAKRLAHYGIFPWTKTGLELFQGIWKSNFHLVRRLDVKGPGDYRNRLVLFKVVDVAAPSSEPGDTDDKEFQDSLFQELGEIWGREK